MYQPAQESSGLWDAWAGTWEVFAEVPWLPVPGGVASSSLGRVPGAEPRAHTRLPEALWQLRALPSRGTGLPLNRLGTAFGCRGQVDRPRGTPGSVLTSAALNA